MKRIITVVFIVFGLVMPALGLDSPGIFLRQEVDDILSLLQDTDLSSNGDQAKIEEELYHRAQGLFDFRTLSMGALGVHWRRFSKDQKKEFTHYFSRLVAHTYFSRMNGKSFNGITIDYGETRLLAPTRSGTRRVDIHTEIHHEGVVTPVDYRMMGTPEKGWRIYDVRIEGVSMVANYREQYRKRFRETPDELIAELKEKLEK